MSIAGIGPTLALMTLAYTGLLAFFIHCCPYDFSLPSVIRRILKITGILLIIPGLTFFTASVTTLLKAYKADSLYVLGVYSLCRNPMYASWIVFIIPGIVLLSNSWILWTIPLFMYLLFRILIRKEEDYLQERFGDSYTDYKNGVPRLCPRL